MKQNLRVIGGEIFLNGYKVADIVTAPSSVLSEFIYKLDGNLTDDEIDCLITQKVEEEVEQERYNAKEEATKYTKDTILESFNELLENPESFNLTGKSTLSEVVKVCKELVQDVF